MRRLLFAVLVLMMGTLPASAQWLDRQWPGIPRTADGKPNLAAPAPRGPDGKPDLTGIWGGGNPEAVLDPANEKPWVHELVIQRQREYHRGRPSYLCLPSGPEVDRFGATKRILQTPTMIVMMMDDLSYRVIHMDGRELEANPAPSWMGYSVGHWEGDALIVDSNGYNEKTWLSRYGQAHTEKLRVREVYRRKDFGHMDAEVTYTDPAAYVKPWGIKSEFRLDADDEVLESICERSSEHWAGTAADAEQKAITVTPEVLAKYVGTYTGIYLNIKRTIEVTLSNGQLIARVIGGAAIDGGEMRPLVPQTDTLFEGVGLGYQFNVDEKGVAKSVTEIKVAGPITYTRVK
jgi:hypothetical protein